jgi:hypothetical protein
MAARKVGRVKATTPKAGVTKNRSRKYCGGGKIFKSGGKLKNKC